MANKPEEGTQRINRITHLYARIYYSYITVKICEINAANHHLFRHVIPEKMADSTSFPRGESCGVVTHDSSQQPPGSREQLARLYRISFALLHLREASFGGG